MATVSPRHAFGLKADVKDNVHYLDEQTVLYPAGHNVVIFNIEQKTAVYLRYREDGGHHSDRCQPKQEVCGGG